MLATIYVTAGVNVRKPVMENDNTLLKTKKSNLLKQINDQTVGRKAVGGFSVILLIIAVILFYQDYFWTSMCIGAIAIICAIVALVITADAELNEVKQIDNELELQYIEQNSAEKKAEQLFKNHQLEIKKYYDLTLKNSGYIFIIGVICIVVGFAFVGLTYFVITSNKAADDNEKYLYGIIGLISTFMTNYIGSIFLRMHAETVKSLGEFHSRLVNTHHLHFANYISQTVTDTDSKNRVLAELISKMIENGGK